MNYYKIKVYTAADQIDRANRVLLGFAAGGTQVYNPSDPDFEKPHTHSWDYFGDEVFDEGGDTVYVAAYVEEDRDLAPLLCELDENGFDSARIDVTKIASENWEESWKQYFKPIRIGGDLVVLPSWESLPADETRTVVTIDPGEAFGTGSHETTSMCLEILKETIDPGDRMLDVGTGSGILAIAAAKLGGGPVTAIDIDARAVDSARQNVELNGVADRVKLIHGELSDLRETSGAFDLVTANIAAAAIVLLAPEIRNRMKEGGRFIASGILEEALDEVLEAIDRAGFVKERELCRGGWIALQATAK